MCFICSESKKYSYCKYNPDDKSHDHLWVNWHNDYCNNDYDDDAYFIECGKYILSFFGHFWMCGVEGVGWGWGVCSIKFLFCLFYYKGVVKYWLIY